MLISFACPSIELSMFGIDVEHDRVQEVTSDVLKKIVMITLVITASEADAKYCGQYTFMIRVYRRTSEQRTDTSYQMLHPFGLTKKIAMLLQTFPVRRGRFWSS